MYSESTARRSLVRAAARGDRRFEASSQCLVEASDGRVLAGVVLEVLRQQLRREVQRRRGARARDGHVEEAKTLRRVGVRHDDEARRDGQALRTMYCACVGRK